MHRALRAVAERLGSASRPAVCVWQAIFHRDEVFTWEVPKRSSRIRQEVF
jgi:hypothetical protein